MAADFPVFIQTGDGNEVFDHIHAHGSGVHAEASSHIAGNAVHPFQAAKAVLDGGGNQFFQPHARSGGEAVPLDFQHIEFSPAGVDDGAAQSAVPDNDVGTAANDVYGDIPVPAIVDGRLHSGKGGRLQPVLGASAYSHGGMA